PTGVTASVSAASDGLADDLDVSWTAPAADGGSPITEYTATASPGGATCTTTGATSCTISDLAPGTYTVAVVATNAFATSAASAASGSATVDEPGADIVSLVPARFFDSRPGEADFDGVGRPGQRIPTGGTIRVQIAGRGEVPADAVGVVANITAVNPSARGFVTVWDCVGDPPTASSLNYVAGQVVPNELVAKLSPTGELCVFSPAETDLLIDVVGSIEPESSLVSLAPRRFFETRPGEQTFDRAGEPGRRLEAGATARVQVTGRGGVAAGTAGVIANVTVVNPSGPGFVTVWDCAGDPPTASSLNYVAGQVVPNELVAKLSPTGELCVFSRSETDLLVDVVGLAPAGSDVLSLSPARFFDSRPGQDDLDGGGRPEQRVSGGETVRVVIGGRGAVPASASGAIVNVTVVNPSGRGFVTVWDCVGDPPTASSLNFLERQTVPNELISKLSPAGVLCLVPSVETDLIVDVVGAIT
ncbi:MAG: fibronectin type III domain-containing protein, partial [Actinomycetota bacterium]